MWHPMTTRLSLLDRVGPGLHPDVAPAAYYQRTLGELNAGGMKLVLEKSLLHYRAWAAVEDDTTTTPAYTFGRALHCALLEPDSYSARWKVLPDYGSLANSTNRARRNLFMERHAGCDFLDAQSAKTIANMVACVHADPEAGALVALGQQESTAVWSDPDTGLPCKARFDHINPEFGYALDAKGVLDASPKAFARAVATHGYHLQQAHYVDGAKACGATLSNFFFLAIEKEPAAQGSDQHAVGLWQIDAASEQRGYDLAARAKAAIAEAMATGHFPSYAGGRAARIGIPPWAHYDDAALT